MPRLAILSAVVALLSAAVAAGAAGPNVLLIVCDDLNDCVDVGP